MRLQLKCVFMNVYKLNCEMIRVNSSVPKIRQTFKEGYQFHPNVKLANCI